MLTFSGSLKIFVAVEPCDMLAEERLHDVGLVGLVAALHHRLHRAGAAVLGGEIGQRREGQRARPADAPRPLHDPEQVHAEHAAKKKE